MFRPLTKQDFAVLSAPLESGRQSPDSLAMALMISLFLQALTYYVTYHIAAETTIYPNVDQIQTIDFWIYVCMIALSLLYSIEFICIRCQKIRYLLTILLSQNIGVSFYLCVLFILGDQENSTVESLMHFTKVTLVIACLFFLVIYIHFYILLMKGHYRRGLKKGELRENFEKISYVPLALLLVRGSYLWCSM